MKSKSMRWMMLAVCGLGCAVLTVTQTGCGGGDSGGSSSLNGYNAIQANMTYQEVTADLGREAYAGSVNSSGQANGQVGWSLDDGGFIAVVFDSHGAWMKTGTNLQPGGVGRTDQLREPSL